MVKVITYGTYDLLHRGHIRLLKRAKALGDYLIVGVTADDFDKVRGKINIKQSLMERVEAVKATGIADEVIVEEYEGQKIDDIRRYGVDIFTVGSDWKGHFDYLNEYCQVVYLPRTRGISSSDLRSEVRRVKLGLVEDSVIVRKFLKECDFVNGIDVVGICTPEPDDLHPDFEELPLKTSRYEELVKNCDALYIASQPTEHYKQIKYALNHGKHVICESPIAMSAEECDELFKIADERKCVLMDAVKTAYATAYTRLMVILKSGIIGKIVSVDATCTSMQGFTPTKKYYRRKWNSISAWGPAAMLPIFQLLGTNYLDKRIVSLLADEQSSFDLFTKIDFLYKGAVASMKVARGAKSEGELVVTGTKGYAYVPAPWWKTDYFEIRYEDPAENKRYFYQLNGEGIRYEIVDFLRAIESEYTVGSVSHDESKEICRVISDFYARRNFFSLDGKEPYLMDK